MSHCQSIAARCDLIFAAGLLLSRQMDGISCREQNMKTMIALLGTHSSRRWSLRRALFSAPLVLICFALLQGAHAVSPAPDGGYPGGNTAEGNNALLGLTSGVWNTALGD